MPLGSPRPALLALLLVAASGCTPRLVHRLDAPDPAAGVWRDGQQARTARGVEAEVSYVRTTRDDHALWVRVTNRSADTVLVDPRLFVERAYQFVHQAELRPEVGRRHPARDPEAELLEVDLEASRRDASARTRQGFAVASAVVTAAVTIADPPETEGEEVAASDAAYSAQVEVADATTDRRLAAEDQVTGRTYWESVLRRTTLPPDTYVDGLVHVPIDPAAKVVVVDVVVGKAVVPFLFLQRNVRP